jgi:hypothetical protein
MFRKFNDWLGDRLSYFLSTMAMFYGIAFLVIAPLIFQKPANLVGWMQYIVAVFFQGVALPVLGYTSRKSGETQAKLLLETHDTVMSELSYIKEQQIYSKEEIASQKKIILELHQIIKEIHKKVNC